MLTDAHGDVGVHIGRQIAERLDRVLLQDAVKVFVILQRVLCLELFAVSRPLGDVRFLNNLVELNEDLLDVAADWDVGGLVLVQLRGINVNVHNLGILGKRLDMSGDPVVKPHSQCDQQIAIADGIIGVRCAVHPQPIHRLFMLGRNRTNSHDRGRYRDASLGNKVLQFFAGVRRHNATTGIDDWSVRELDGGRDLTNRFTGYRGKAGIVTWQVHRGIHLQVGQVVELDILGHVHQHWAGTTTLADVKGFLHDPWQVGNLRHQVMVLRDPTTNFDHGRLLECVTTNCLGRNLACDAKDGNAVEFGICDGRHQIRGTRAAGCHHHPDFPRAAGVTLGREGAALLMSGQDRANRLAIPGQCLMHRHAAPARIREKQIDPMIHQRFNQNIGAGHQSGLGGSFRSTHLLLDR